MRMRGINIILMSMRMRVTNIKDRAYNKTKGRKYGNRMTLPYTLICL